MVTPQACEIQFWTIDGVTGQNWSWKSPGGILSGIHISFPTLLSSGGPPIYE